MTFVPGWDDEPKEQGVKSVGNLQGFTPGWDEPSPQPVAVPPSPQQLEPELEPKKPWYKTLDEFMTGLEERVSEELAKLGQPREENVIDRMDKWMADRPAYPRDLRQLGEWAKKIQHPYQTAIEGAYGIIKDPTTASLEGTAKLDTLRAPIEWAQSREAEATNAREWFIKLAKDFPKVMAYDIPRAVLYDMPKPFTDAALKYAMALYEGRRYSQGGDKLIEREFLEDLGTALWMTVNGVGQFLGKPLGFYGYAEWKNIWLKDPATALAGIISFGAPFFREAAARRAAKPYSGPVPEEPPTKPGPSEWDIELYRQHKLNEDFERSIDLFEETLAGPDEKVLNTKQELNASLEKIREQKAGPLVETAEGWKPIPEARQGPVSPTEVSQFELQQLIPKWALTEGAERPWNITGGEPLSIKRTKAEPTYVGGYQELSNGVLVQKTGEPFKNATSAKAARASLKKEGLNYEVTKVADKKFALRPETLGERKAMEEATAAIEEIERNVPKYKPKREETRAAEDILDAVEIELADEVPAGPEIGMETHPFEQTPETTRVRTEKYKLIESSIRNDPEVFVAYQINNVNRWRQGENLPIDQIVNSLQEVAMRVDELKQQLPLPQDRLALKNKATEAWVWAERVRRERLQSEIGVPESGVVKMHGGPDPVGKVRDILEGLREAKRTPLISRLAKTKAGFYKSIIDTQGNLKSHIEKWAKENSESTLGNWINSRIILARGGGARAAEYVRMYKKLIYGGLTRDERVSLDDLIFLRRVIQIDNYEAERVAAGGKSRNIKHPGGMTGTEASAYIESFGRSMGEAKYNRLMKRADAYFDSMRQQLKILRDEGIISEKSYNNLSRFDWQRREAIETLDPIIHLGKFKSRLDVRDSGVEALKAGEVTDILETDSLRLLEDWVARSMGRVYRNRANQAMAELVRRYPENPFIREKKPNDKWYAVNFYEGGKEKTYYMPKEWAKEWLLREADITYQAAQRMRIISGSSLLRPMATGINPGFAFTNIIRDSAHIWLVSNYMDAKGKWRSVYNPVTFPLQMGRDIATTFVDSVFRTGTWKDAIEDGIGMEFLAWQGRLMEQRLGKHQPFEGVQTALGWLNMTSEIMMRNALRNRAVKRIARREGLTTEQIHSEPKYRRFREEASAVARNYLDFGQGGSFTKMIDSSVPYINAATQATRGIFRTAQQNPKGAMAKVGVLATTAAALYLAQRYNSPEALKDTDPRTLAKNWVFFPFGNSGFIDENGQRRYVGLKVPKDQGQMFFATFAENVMKKLLGEEIDVDQVVSTLREFSPADTSSLPPTLSALLGYAVNRDFWTLSDIWKGPKVSPEREYRKGETPEYAIDVGQALGLSPERLDYMLKEVFTSGNAYTWVMGAGYNKMFSDVPEDLRQKHVAMFLSEAPIAKRFIFVTNPYSEYRKVVEEATVSVNDKRLALQDEFDLLLTGRYDYGSVTHEELTNFLARAENKEDADRLISRWKFFVKVRGLSERGLWLAMHRANPEARARIFYEAVVEKSPEERDRLISEMVLVPGIITKEFKQYYRAIKKE